MADDASGTDSDDGQQEPSVPESDGPKSSPNRERETDDWTVIDRTESTTQDGWTIADDDSVRDESDDDSSDEYRVPLDLSSGGDEGNSDESESAENEDDPHAPEPSSTPIEPGDPDLESAIFVFLGAIAMAFVLFRVVSIPL